MADPTIATVDDEPWNQKAPTSAIVIPIENGISIYERVMRGMPILTPNGTHAEYVYDVSGQSNGSAWCERCAAHCGGCSMWHEWVHGKTRDDHKRFYRVVRMFFLCKSCSAKLKTLPTGERFRGPNAFP
jgi:hypothetical protein